MQIDVLSQNTLKLTLSRLDMFDLDIKYESLSGKNPDTKRLLSHVLRTVKLDKSAGVDFSGERLFVEAFPRPDGGCMLYISSLSEDEDRTRKPEKRIIRPISPAQRKSEKLLCKFDSIKELEGVCKSLIWHKTDTSSTLYSNENEYRLIIHSNKKKLITMIVSEYGEVLDEDEIGVTSEHYQVIVHDNAIEQMNEVL